jgi:hypothetical protein
LGVEEVDRRSVERQPRESALAQPGRVEDAHQHPAAL